jgi:hypothetical protein
VIIRIVNFAFTFWFLGTHVLLIESTATCKDL